jgi:hypothetical protein
MEPEIKIKTEDAIFSIVEIKQENFRAEESLQLSHDKIKAEFDKSLGYGWNEYVNFRKFLNS